MEAVDLVLGQMLFPEGPDFTKIIMIDVVPVDQVTLIADDADLFDHIHIRAELLFKLAPDRKD